MVTTHVCFPSVLQVIAATNRVDTLDPALLRSGEDTNATIVMCARLWLRYTYVHVGHY